MADKKKVALMGFPCTIVATRAWEKTNNDKKDNKE